jgi:glycosyltransferase involved in cell wall biosynthesis
VVRFRPFWISGKATVRSDELAETPRVSVLISLVNFAENVSDLYGSLVAVLESRGEPFEVVCVDDGSQDDTLKQLIRLADRDKRLRVIKMRETFGESAALEAALRYSNGNQIVYLSGRVRVNPATVIKLLDQLKKFDLVMGWRHPRRDFLVNRTISWLFNRLASRLSKVRLHDINSGVFVSKRNVLERLSIYGDMINFIPVLASQQGYHITEAQVEQQPGSFRMSRYPTEYIQRFLDMITVFFLTRYSKKPIHLMGFFGALFFLSGMIIELYLGIYRLLRLGPIAGRPLLILGALLLVIGIQMITIGLLGEMIIFTHAGEIEEYNIEEIIN